jgi:hypothetical protein
VFYIHKADDKLCADLIRIFIMTLPRSGKEATSSEAKNTQISLSFEQERALRKLASYGLTAEHFKECRWFYGEGHIDALCYLMIQRKMPADQALKYMRGLDSIQAGPIIYGFKPDELKLLNSDQCFALEVLHDKGLTPALLLPRPWFNISSHRYALTSLTREHGERNMTIQQALQEIDKLEYYQADAISKGLWRADVLDLTRKQCFALSMLHRQGLTRAHLSGKSWFNGDGHYEALNYLIIKCNMSPAAAMLEIDGLESFQAAAISKGLTRTDVIGMPFDSCYALRDLHSHGLTRAHLENHHWLTELHFKALKILMLHGNDANLNADDAIDLIAKHKDNNSVLFDIIDGAFTQRQFLDHLLAHKQLKTYIKYSLKDGIFFAPIKEAKMLNLGTKLLYLERAITEDCYEFITSLDKLYKEFVDDNEKMEMIKVIIALKKINNMCFNNTEIYPDKSRPTVKLIGPCLSGMLSDLRSEYQPLKIDPTVIQQHIQSIIKNNILLMKKRAPKKARRQIQERSKLEATIQPDTKWRTFIELPEDQLTFISTTEPLLKKPKLFIESSFPHIRVFKRNTLFSPPESKDLSIGHSMSDLTISSRSSATTQKEGIEVLFATLDAEISSVIKSKPKKLTAVQTAALEALADYGLTADHLRNQDWFNDSYHTDALRYLMTQQGPKNMPVDQAMRTLDSLDYSQAKLITKGFSRQEVCSLHHYETRAVLDLHMHGLTPAHVKNENVYCLNGVMALKSLMTERDEKHTLPADKAVVEIRGLDSAQLDAISRGFSRCDVIGLDYSACSALTRFHKHGLTRDDLVGKHWLQSNHVDALYYLIVERRMGPEQAMLEIDHLKYYQVELISEGRSNVIDLSMEQCNTLKKLRPYQLTCEHLRSCPWLSYRHAAALENLMTERGSANLTADDAIALVTAFKDDQDVLDNIMRGGPIPEKPKATMSLGFR